VASNPVDFTVQSKQFTELSKRLKSSSKELRKELNKEIRAAAKPAVDDVKAAVLAINSKVSGASGLNSGETARAVHAGSGKIQRSRSHGLRATIARAVQLKITTNGVRIVVDSSKLPEGQKNLAKALDNPKGWRHPTFGHEPWVTQTGDHYFEPNIEKRKDDIRSRITAAMHTIAEKVRG
jgi:hypothetical protein